MDSYCGGRKIIKAPEGFSRAMVNNSYKGKVYEYILIASRKIGRDVKPSEVVHHIDGDKTNNAEDNLMVIHSNRAHAILHRNGCDYGLLTKLADGTYDVNWEKWNEIEYARGHRVCVDCGAPIHRQTHGCRCVSCSRKRARRVTWPSKEDLEHFVWTEPSSAVAKRYGVCDTTVRKWCIRYGISKPPRGYWAKVKAGKI